MTMETATNVWLLALGGILFAFMMFVIDMRLIQKTGKRFRQWCAQVKCRRVLASLTQAEINAHDGHVATNVVVQQRTADVAMADLDESLRRLPSEWPHTNLSNSSRRDAEPPAPPPDRTDQRPSIIETDFAQAEARVVAAMTGALSEGLGPNHGARYMASGDDVDFTAMSYHSTNENDTSLGEADESYTIKVAPLPPGSPDPEDEECDLWVNTGTKPATFVFPDNGEWSEIAALHTPLRGASVTLSRKDDVYVTITTTVAPGLGTHLAELEILRAEQRVFWEHMSPALTTWLGGMTHQERTFVLSLIGVSAPGGRVPNRPGKRPVRDIDLG